MKNQFILMFLTLYINMVSGQLNTSQNPLAIIPTSNITAVKQFENGEFNIYVNHDDLKRFKRQGFVQYGDMGATGDGVLDDMIYIVATHSLANSYGLDVKADNGAKYYIGGKEMTASIETNTDFGNASFIIDDRELKNRLLSVFEVKSQLNPIAISAVKSLKKGQDKIDIKLKEDCLVTVSDANVRRYIRYGLNQNKGRDQTDIFILDKII